MLNLTQVRKYLKLARQNKSAVIKELFAFDFMYEDDRYDILDIFCADSFSKAWQAFWSLDTIVSDHTLEIIEGALPELCEQVRRM